MSNLKKFHSNATSEFKKVGIEGKFTIIKESSIKNPKIVSCVSVFRMPDPYKDESIYINGLNFMLDNFDRVMPNSILRIYYDDSVVKKDDKWEFLIVKAKTKKFTQVIHYDFIQFKKKNSFYHEGVFGMIVRYFPLFNFSNESEIVTIDDIDHYNLKEFEEHYTMIKTGLACLKSTKLTFAFGSYGYRAYINKPRLMVSYITEKYDFSNRMITQPSMCAKKLNKNILVDFMLCVLEKCNIYNNWMSELITNLKCNNISKENLKRIQQCNYIKEIEKLNHGVFMFGTDEFFLNGPILEEFLKNKKQFIIYYEMPTMAHYHYALFLMFKQRRLPLQFMINMYVHILQTAVHNVKDVYTSFKIVDEQIYNLAPYNRFVINNDNSKKIFEDIFKYLQPRADELLNLNKLERFEIQMFKYLKNTHSKDFIIGRKFYEVSYKSDKQYELIRLN